MGARVETVMGTVVSIDVRDPGPGARAVGDAVEAVVGWLHEVDARFSVFRVRSEIRRLDRGEITLDDCHRDVRDVLRTCERLRAETGGAFDVGRHRPDRRLDPSGFVKGWAVDAAVDMLVAAGARSFVVNAGGDVVVRGEPAPGRAWRVGIRHPVQADRVAAVIRLREAAVATSGLYERGGHIRDPRSGRVPADLVSLTVVGPTLGLADAYATAAFAMGTGGPAWVARRPGYGVLAIDREDRVRWSTLVDQLLDWPGVVRPGADERSGILQDGESRMASQLPSCPETA